MKQDAVHGEFLPRINLFDVAIAVAACRDDAVFQVVFKQYKRGARLLLAMASNGKRLKTMKLIFTGIGNPAAGRGCGMVIG